MLICASVYSHSGSSVQNKHVAACCRSAVISLCDAERRESVAVRCSQAPGVKGFCCAAQVRFDLINGSSDCCYLHLLIQITMLRALIIIPHYCRNLCSGCLE